MNSVKKECNCGRVVGGLIQNKIEEKTHRLQFQRTAKRKLLQLVISSAEVVFGSIRSIVRQMWVLQFDWNVYKNQTMPKNTKTCATREYKKRHLWKIFDKTISSSHEYKMRAFCFVLFCFSSLKIFAFISWYAIRMLQSQWKFRIGWQMTQFGKELENKQWHFVILVVCFFFSCLFMCLNLRPSIWQYQLSVAFYRTSWQSYGCRNNSRNYDMQIDKHLRKFSVLPDTWEVW